MALSLNPVDLWKLFKESKKNDREKIAEWMDEVAADARSMATVWTETYQKLCTGALKPEDEDDIMRNLGFHRNINPNTRLREFYRTASTVIGGRVEHDLQERFAHAMGTALASRETAVRIHRAILWKCNEMRFFLDDQNKSDDISDFRKVVDILNREAAALEVLAKNFRASA